MNSPLRATQVVNAVVDHIEEEGGEYEVVDVETISGS